MKTESLTFTRFIAAFCVLVFHLGYDVFPFNLYLVKNFFRHSNIFVSYFFFLSGFVMIIAYDKHIKTNQFNKSLYWIKRIARIYPLYFIALLLYTCIAILALDYKLDTGHLILNLFLLQSWTEKTALTLNFPGWSLSVEFLFYALFPLLIKLINTVNLSRNLVTFSLI